MPLTSKVLLPLLLGVGLVGTTARPAAAQKTYVAVGDSLAYGFKSISPTPNLTPLGGPGFPGYAAAYRSTLQSQTGTTYSLLNLGIVGETTGALFASTQGGLFTNSNLNSNYAAGNPTQAGLLHTLLTAPGSSVGVITIQVGANDVLEAVENGGLAAAPAALAAVQSNYTIFLNQIKSDEGGGPLTNVTVMGYYDAFAKLSPASPYASLLASSGQVTASLNGILAQEAATFGARYVDLYTPFAAHLSDYDNYVLTNSSADALPPPGTFTAPFPNNHPTDRGYALIAQTLAAPEPSVTVPLCLGALGLAGLALRARRRRA